MKDAAHKSKFHNAALKPLENGSHISLQYLLNLSCNYTPAKLGSSQFQGPSLDFLAHSSLDYPPIIFFNSQRVPRDSVAGGPHPAS